MSSQIKIKIYCEVDATDPRMRALLSIAVYRVMLLFVEEIKR